MEKVLSLQNKEIQQYSYYNYYYKNQLLIFYKNFFKKNLIKSIKFKNFFLIFTSFFYYLFIILFLSQKLDAQIITDGTTGQKLELKGPDYIINQDLGKISGKNLFHSFSLFDINKKESAIFTGSSNISNVISRVTGKQSSFIDGLLKSEIKGADFYFINPNGIMFGPDAKIDIQGSFYAGTADYIKFDDKNKFNADNTNISSFTSATPEAFGFLGKNINDIKIKGSVVWVLPEKTISIVAGNIYINDATLFTQSGHLNLSTINDAGEILLNNPSKTTNYNGSIVMDNSIVANEGYGKGAVFIGAGNLIINNSVISSYHDGEYDGGDINIYLNKDFSMNGGFIQSVSDSYKNSGDISIYAGNFYISAEADINSVSKQNGNAGDININSKGNLYLTGFSQDDRTSLHTFTAKGGKSGNIKIQGHNVDIDNYAVLLNISEQTGKRGNIEITADNFNLSDHAIIKGGNIYGEIGNMSISEGAYIWSYKNPLNDSQREIRLDIKEYLNITGEDQDIATWRNKDAPLYTGIHTDSFVTSRGDAGDIYINCPYIKISHSGDITARTFIDGNAGNIVINTNKMELFSGGEIGADSFGSSIYHGNAGEIIINAKDYILLSGKKGELYSGFSAGTRSSGGAGAIIVNSPDLKISDDASILVATGVFGEGKAGEIYINVDNLEIFNHGGVTASSVGYGTDGKIQIKASDKVVIRDDGFIVSLGDKEGDAGSIYIETGILEVKKGRISTTTSGEKSAGDINIRAHRLAMSDNSKITSESYYNSLFYYSLGDAGNIFLDISHIFEMDSSSITTAADFTAGGNIQINAGATRLRNNSEITATVFGGEGGGGDVRMNSDSFVAIEGTSVTARADQGKGGNIQVNSHVFLKDRELEDVLNASSNVTGNDGTVQINAPELDLSGKIAVLPQYFIDVSGLISDPCGISRKKDNSSLVVEKCGNIIFMPYNFF